MTICASECCAFASWSCCACGLESWTGGGCFVSFCGDDSMGPSGKVLTCGEMGVFHLPPRMAVEVQGLEVGLGMFAVVHTEEQWRRSTNRNSKDTRDRLARNLDDINPYNPS
mmetsp:Transcript_2737/g.4558  ORF Transcript_2737/g.4558 Transcript_2737/m.4558 type:complete len:112 (-) Transcript_2737:361-696(-)